MFYDGFLSRMIESYHNMTYGQVVGNAIHVRRLRSNLWPSPYSISNFQFPHISSHISTVTFLIFHSEVSRISPYFVLVMKRTGRRGEKRARLH